MRNHKPQIVLILAITWGLIPSSAARAEESLAELVAAAKASYRAVSAEDVDKARTALVESLAVIRAKAGSWKDEEWADYLKLNVIDGEIAKPAPDLSTLRSVQPLFQADKAGLERAEIGQARRRLRTYVNSMLIQRNKDAKALYLRQVESLGKLLDTYEKEATNGEALSIGLLVGSLDSVGQAQPLINELENRYRRPNLHAQVSERLASKGFSEDINRVQGVREYILGTTVRGTARMVGRTSLDLQSNNNRASLLIRLRGSAYSTNVGYNRGVTIHSRGNTSINATKRIQVDENGLHALPARASCRTSTRVGSICHKSKLVRKIAKRRVAQQKGKAEVIASRRAAGRVARQVDDQSRDLVAEANENYTDKLRNPLLRKDSFPKVDLATTNDLFNIALTQANGFEIAAHQAAPALESDLDLALRLHQTSIANLSTAFIGGQKLTSKRLKELLEELKADVPEELKKDDEWSITFSPAHPIRVTFGPSTAHISIRGRQFTRGDTVVNSEMEISAKYKVAKMGNGSKLVRDGDVIAQYTKKAFENAEKIAIKTVMRKKFTALFKEEMASDGLELPGRWAKVGKLHLRQLHCKGGWLALGWVVPDTHVASAATPAGGDAAE